MAGGSFISHDFVLSGISGLSLYLDDKIWVWVWESMEVIEPSLIHRLSPHANKWKAGWGLHGNEARSSPSPVRCVHIVYLVCSFKKKGMQKSALPGMSSFVLQDWCMKRLQHIIRSDNSPLAPWIAPLWLHNCTIKLPWIYTNNNHYVLEISFNDSWQIIMPTTPHQFV